MPLPAVLHPLTHPAYRRLLWSSALWWLTLAMWTVVAGLLVLDLTNSALAVALLTFWRRGAQLLLGGFAGPIGDRLGRRKTLLLTQSCIFLSCAGVLLLLAGGGLAGWHVTVAAFAIGAAWTVDMPARTALTPDLVGQGQTADAMLVESFAQGAVGSLGAYAAGWLLESYGPGPSVGALVGLTGLNLAILWLFSRQEVARTVAVGGQTLWHSLGEGVRYVAGNQTVLAVTAVSVVLNLLIFPSMSLLPVFARDVLNRGALGLGLLSAGYHLGTFVGLYAVLRLRPYASHGLLFTLGALMECAALLLFAFSSSFAIAWAMLFVAGLGQAAFHTLRATILLTSASDEMRGRALSTVVLTQGAGLPGELQTGLLAEWIGVGPTVGMQAGLSLLLTGAAALVWPLLWRGEREKR
ncbi:MAG: MFS transporter [Caldilineaceae bacterium]|nr:MFS transporter [Caldilineaceae bacterium]HRJ41558.1 MFS transporter [Caldilineaceae bacterium]